MAESDAQAKSFTSRKLDMIDLISTDRRLSPTARLVAIRLLQHENRTTGAIFPSQARIAAQIGISTRHVRNCIAELEIAQWLTKERPNRHRSNVYAFCSDGLNASLDQAIIDAEDENE